MIPVAGSALSAQCGGRVLAPSGSWRIGIVAAITTAGDEKGGCETVEATYQPLAGRNCRAGSSAADNPATETSVERAIATNASQRFITILTMRDEADVPRARPYGAPGASLVSWRGLPSGLARR